MPPTTSCAAAPMAIETPAHPAARRDPKTYSSGAVARAAPTPWAPRWWWPWVNQGHGNHEPLSFRSLSPSGVPKTSAVEVLHGAERSNRFDEGSAEDAVVFALVARRRRRPPFVDGLGRIGADLQIRAVMVRISPRLVVAVIRHELNHLQGAPRAADVRQLDVGVPRSHWRLGSAEDGSPGFG